MRKGHRPEEGTYRCRVEIQEGCLEVMSGSWEMDQWVKVLPCKHEDLSSNLRLRQKADTCSVSICNLSTPLRRHGHGNPSSLQPAWPGI